MTLQSLKILGNRVLLEPVSRGINGSDDGSLVAIPQHLLNKYRGLITPNEAIVRKIGQPIKGDPKASGIKRKGARLTTTAHFQMAELNVGDRVRFDNTMGCVEVEVDGRKMQINSVLDVQAIV